MRNNWEIVSRCVNPSNNPEHKSSTLQRILHFIFKKFYGLMVHFMTMQLHIIM